MAHREWYFSGQIVELDHTYLSGKAKLYVDGELIFERPPPWFYNDVGFAHRFNVGKTPCAVRVVSNGVAFRYELLTGEEAEMVVDADHLPIERRLIGLAIFNGILAVVAALTYVILTIVF